MDAKALLASRRRARERKVELIPASEGREARVVTITRPPEADVPSLMTGDGDKRTFSIDLDHVRKYVVGWAGFTEADFLGEGVGGSDPVPFDATLWADLCADNILWVNVVASAILNVLVDYYTAKADVAKNSAPA